MEHSPLGSSVHGDSPGKNTGVGCHALLQGILPTRDRTQVSCIAGRFFTVLTTRLPHRMEASFKLSPLWGHTRGRNKALGDHWSWYVNPALRGEPWDSLSLALQWMIPWMTQVPQGIHLCTYLAVSWNFFHKILRIHMSLSTLRLTFYKDKNWLAYCWYFAKYLLIYFPWSRVVDNPHHSSILQDALIRRPSHHSLLCLFCFFCWGRGWIYLDFSEGDLEKAAFSLLI